MLLEREEERVSVGVGETGRLEWTLVRERRAVRERSLPEGQAFGFAHGFLEKKKASAVPRIVRGKEPALRLEEPAARAVVLVWCAVAPVRESSGQGKSLEPQSEGKRVEILQPVLW